MKMQIYNYCKQTLNFMIIAIIMVSADKERESAHVLYIPKPQIVLRIITLIYCNICTEIHILLSVSVSMYIILLYIKKMYLKYLIIKCSNFLYTQRKNRSQRSRFENRIRSQNLAKIEPCSAYSDRDRSILRLQIFSHLSLAQSFFSSFSQC